MSFGTSCVFGLNMNLLMKLEAWFNEKQDQRHQLLDSLQLHAAFSISLSMVKNSFSKRLVFDTRYHTESACLRALSSSNSSFTINPISSVRYRDSLLTFLINLQSQKSHGSPFRQVSLFKINHLFRCFDGMISSRSVILATAYEISWEYTHMRAEYVRKFRGH